MNHAAAAPETKWNPRYVAYGAGDGLDPDATLERDRERWPGGCMTGFILWIGDRWREWSKSSGEKPSAGDSWDDRQHHAFDTWLADRSRSVT